MTQILIESKGLNDSTPVLVNGQLRKRIFHGVATPVDDDELEALTNSNVTFTVVDGAASAPEAAGGAEGGLSASPRPARKRAPKKAAAKRDPLDHDGKGGKGGSKKGAQSTRAKGAAKKAAAAKAPKTETTK